MRIGIIGSSGHYPVVLQALKTHPEAEICAIAPGLPQENIEKLAEQCRSAGAAPSVCRNWKEMLADEHIELAVINSWFGRNGEIVIYCLNHHIPVYAEKPLAASEEELSRVEKTWRETGCPLGVMLTLRYAPWFLAMDQAVKEGKIGQVRLLHGQKSYKLGTRPDFFRNREMFTGLIPWVGIHAIDWILHFGGKCVQVSSLHTTACNRGMGEMEMSSASLLRLENDVFATLSVDYLRPDGAARHDDDRLRLTGTLGTMEAVDGKVYLEDASGPRRALPLPEAQNPFSEFLAQLHQGTTEEITLAGLEATRIALQLRASADRNSM